MKSYISRKLPLETRTTDQIFVFRSSEKLIRFMLCFRTSCLVRRTNTNKAYDHVIAELRRATELSLSGPPALARTFAVSGRITEARILLEQLQQSKRQYVAPFYVTIVYAGLGENERALDWLEKVYVPTTPTLSSFSKVTRSWILCVPIRGFMNCSASCVCLNSPPLRHDWSLAIPQSC